MSSRYAFFDVDNTIYNGYTASGYVQFLVKEGLAAPRLAQAYETMVPRYTDGKISYSDFSQWVLNLCSEAVAGRSELEVRHLVELMITERKQIFFTWVAPVVNYLRSQHFQLILISAGPDFAISQISKLIKADAFFATEIPLREDRYTGEKTGLLNDTLKVERIKSMLGNSKDSITVGFGDSPGDADMLDLMDLAFVRASDHHPTMASMAKKKGWTVFSEPQIVIQTVRKSISARPSLGE